ncbi:SdpI family protein [Tenacibaculum sp. SSH1-16]|uniref:SdpI family protein n=1 Tax=Tenacibaculum sp. SSH1-16 TaxID=3136667 RepID=UPI0032C47CDC|nr:hypothetical protein BACT7_11320 [Tenacibaculum mesophilum]
MNPFYYVLSINGLLFLFSIIFHFFPPKKINAIYGYRTNKTMKNDTIWQFANTFFTKEFMKYSAVSLVASLVLAFISKELTWQPMAIMLLSLAVSVVKTEQEINKNFDGDGNRK